MKKPEVKIVIFKDGTRVVYTRDTAAAIVARLKREKKNAT